MLVHNHTLSFSLSLSLTESTSLFSLMETKKLINSISSPFHSSSTFSSSSSSSSSSALPHINAAIPGANSSPRSGFPILIPFFFFFFLFLNGNLFSREFIFPWISVILFALPFSLFPFCLFCV